MKYIFLFWLLLIQFFSIQVYAQKTQEIHGMVKDTAGTAQIGASVNLHSPLDRLTTATDAKGHFLFTGVKADSFSITVTSMGFKTYTNVYKNENSNKVLKLS